MKKVLKLIVLVAMISALTLAAFAASPEVEVVENESGAAEIAAITAEAPEGVDVEVVAPTESMAAANEAAAKAANPDALVMDSFDINVTDAEGNELHTGATVTVTLTVPAEFVGGALNLYEDGVLAQTVTIGGTTVTLVITTFSTYTPVLVKAAPVVPVGPVTPQTMQTLLPYALVVLAVAALAVAVVAKKRSFN